jgi:hypothetical protein
VREWRLLIILIFCCSILLTYTAYRSWHLSFTHDESLTYSFVAGDSSWRGTANNHPLNTRLMSWTYRWLGMSEWSLRLPNVVAHLLYLTFGLLLLRELQDPWLIATGFAFLNLNPFLLDFFSMARGYGIALGLSTASLYFFRRAWNGKGLIPTTGLLLLSLMWASLADLGNYAWLNIHLPLLAASLFVIWSRYHPCIFSFRRDGPTVLATAKVDGPAVSIVVLLTAVNGWFVYNLARRIWALRQQGQLYVGGENGFLTDTVGSLVTASFYTQIYPEALKKGIIEASVVALFVAIGVALFRTRSENQVSFSGILTIILVLTILASVAQHHMFQTLYPTDRTALYYVPLAGFAAVFTLDESFARRRVGRVLTRIGSLVAIVAMVFHFSKTANLTRTYVWAYDAETRNVMLDIGKHFESAGKSQRISLANFWAFEPSINYYRALLGYDWLTPANREDIVLAGHDVVYCYPQQLENQKGRYEVLHQYVSVGTVLVKVTRESP